jgi:Protein of unknown function DUF262/Protein of unknown function (DUF1524)/Restriction Enzyme Adenine Methylase Associated
VETLVRTPQLVFNQPQRLIVPLFQRPYVWNEENQWAPLWQDLIRIADRMIASPQVKQTPHFLGAVVLQQLQTTTGSLQVRTIIDGQQRLTTLQLLLDALHAELDACGATQPAKRIESLVRNDDAYWEHEEDRFKVWPTNRDRPSFNAVMAAPPPVDYDSLGFGGRLVEAHRFFAQTARDWLLAGGPEGIAVRAAAIERTVREHLQIVVIDLTADENAQEIFETLNARGAQLTAADLIKNFIFQRLMEAGVDVEAAYEKNWKEFETGFWEAEFNFGRLRYSRSSIFLNHWLIARTGEEIPAREVFSRFKRYADSEAGVPMSELLAQIQRSAAVYRSFLEAVSNTSGTIDRLGMFAYRSSTLDVDVFKSVVLWLLDPEKSSIPQAQLTLTLEAIESWLVRRMLVRASTNSYNQVAADLVTELSKCDRLIAGSVTQAFLGAQTAASRYWPDDEEVIREARSLAAYSRLRRSRLRMLLEAFEDHRRGWIGSAEGLGGQRVLRGKYAIEHVMPQSWQANWPLGQATEQERQSLVHVLGNLTLLTGALNSKVSNGPWEQKRIDLKKHDVLKLNMDLVDAAAGGWDEDGIAKRTDEFAQSVVAIWSVPEGHVSNFSAVVERPARRVTIADLIGASILEPGTTLYPRRSNFKDRTATVLTDGRIDVDGVAYTTPSGAATGITGKSENGWWFFLLSPTDRKSLSDLWHEYVDQSAIDVDENDMPDEADDDDRTDNGG